MYAAALNSGVDGSLPLITPATVLPDEPTTFEYSNRSYAPRDYGEDYRGTVTVRAALTYSLNVPAVSLAEMVGYNKVRNLAMRAGFNDQLEPTPALALGAYVATPLEVAGGYTIFAHRGEHVAPRCIVAVADTNGRTVWENPVSTRRVLDSRVSYLMVSLLESVINNGTGAGVRARGFRLPAAGKTGTSHDGWFAGFTSEPSRRSLGRLRRRPRPEHHRRSVGSTRLDRIHEAGDRLFPFTKPHCPLISLKESKLPRLTI